MLAQGIKETTSTTGTGPLSLSASSGFIRYSQWFPDGALAYYTIMSGADGSGGVLEWGIGTVNVSANTLDRTTVLGTFSGGTLVTASPTAISLTGSNLVVCALPAGGAPANVGNFSATNGSSGATVPYPHIVSGAAPAITLTANRLYLIPFRIESPRKITAVKGRVSTGVAGNVNIGIYGMKSNGEAGNLIASSGDISTASSGSVVTWTLGTPLVLPSDWYCFGIAAKGIAPGFNGSASGAGSLFCTDHPFGTGSTSVLPVMHKYAALTGGWTSLPTPAPTSLTSGGITAFPLLSLVHG